MKYHPPVDETKIIFCPNFLKFVLMREILFTNIDLFGLRFSTEINLCSYSKNDIATTVVIAIIFSGFKSINR